MNEKKPYGANTAESFELGDIVEWSIWSSYKETFVPHYGVITEIKNKLISNRLVSICTAVPLDNSSKEIELFSLSLTLVSKAGEEKNEIDS
jgi:hypothetical protein